MREPSTQMMEKDKSGWKTENNHCVLKEEGRKLWHLNFLLLVLNSKVPDSVPDEELLQQNDCPLDGNGKPARYTTELLEFRMDNYWTGDKMVDWAVKTATCVFSYAYPGCQALFAFDNSSNYSYYANDALLVGNINLSPGGKQSILRNGFNHMTQEVHSMLFSDNHPNLSLWGKPKESKQVLIKRGL